MNFQHLEYFNELAETQYLAQAAEKLGISQPTLSYAVKKQEEELGVLLLEREGRNIRLRWPWAKAASCQSGSLK